jgi:hypothetical protein
VPLPAVAAEDLTGIVVNRRGVPLADVDVTLGGVVYTTDDDGRFRFEGAGAGAVSAERVAYLPQTANWDGRRDFVTITLPERIARGVHIAGWVPATDAGFRRCSTSVRPPR